jgi:hypothetical protein
MDGHKVAIAITEIDSLHVSFVSPANNTCRDEGVFENKT